MQKAALLALFLCLTLIGFSAVHKTRRSLSRKHPSTTAARSSTATRKATGRSVAATKKHSTKRGRRSSVRAKKKRVASWRTRQQAPTPERYKEIQQALADRGYFQGLANGVWGADSVEALKKFQGDQNLQPTGKLDALSLITLGLGPRRESNLGTGDAGAARLLPAPSGLQDQSAERGDSRP